MLVAGIGCGGGGNSNEDAAADNFGDSDRYNQNRLFAVFQFQSPFKH
jgi:hypothetical protein